jgi:hypothetical protein
VATLGLTAQPLIPLFQYYRQIDASGMSGQTVLDLSRQIVTTNNGEPVYIGYSDELMKVAGIPYVPQVHMFLAGIYTEFLSRDKIVGRLFERPGPAILLVSDDDAAYLQQVAGLDPWPGPANFSARQHGYGLYQLDTTVPLKKPDFVLVGEAARSRAPHNRVNVRVGAGLELMGYDVAEGVRAGASVDLDFYWQALQAMPAGTYIGFVHLLDSTGSTLIAQSDHQLGQDLYPVNAWQPDEVVIDHYRLAIPAGAAPGQYVLRVGVYTWPSLERLAVPGHGDNLIELLPVTVASTTPD